MRDYSTVRADKTVGTAIGRMYLDTDDTVTDLARQAYAEFADQIEDQFSTLPVRVEFQDDDPYKSAEEMFADVSNRRLLKVYRTTGEQSHPLLTNTQNNMFRAVHDYYGHHRIRRGFDRHGEEAAWMHHSQMFRGLARRAMTTETRGQSSAFVWINGGREFPSQKAILLPEWVSTVPA